MNRRIRVYIASPYTLGDVAVNVRTQMDAFAELMDAGFAPHAPLYSHFQHMVHPRSYSTWLALDFEWIPTCDCLVRLPGESAGADAEVALAEQLGLPIFHSTKEAIEYYKKAGKL